MIVGPPAWVLRAAAARLSPRRPATTMWARSPRGRPLVRSWKVRAPPIHAGSVPLALAPRSGPWSSAFGRSSQRLQRPCFFTRTWTATSWPERQRAPIRSNERPAATGLEVAQPARAAPAGGSGTSTAKWSVASRRASAAPGAVSAGASARPALPASA